MELHHEDVHMRFSTLRVPMCLYKSERCAQAIFTKISPDFEFVKGRPQWLYGLELDGFGVIVAGFRIRWIAA
jgi:hypothetical protein